MLLAAVGVAVISRIAKNFQDYFVNLITQQVGARIYADGVIFARLLRSSGITQRETLDKLQKVRTDVEKFIDISVNLLFTTVIGVIFVTMHLGYRGRALPPIS